MDSDALPLSRPSLDRDAARRTDPQLIPQLVADPLAEAVLVCGGKVAIAADDGAAPRLFTMSAPDAVAKYGTEGIIAYLGVLGGKQYIAFFLPKLDVIGGMMNLRSAGALLPAGDAALATCALALANWHRGSHYCPRCGRPTEVIDSGWVRRCVADSSMHFPRTDAAVIMAITDPSDRLLIARSMAWPEGKFSVPAGFVEPGEPLENAVRREVFEELKVSVGGVNYRASQPWPFPASLMCAFSGQTEDEVAQPDGVEIAAARFITRDDFAAEASAGRIVPPGKLSIARALIDDWYGGEGLPA